MRSLIVTQYPVTSLAKPRTTQSAYQAQRATRSDARDFAVIALFAFAVMTAGYLALWRPLLAHLLP